MATGPALGPGAPAASGSTTAPARPVLDLFKLLTPAEAYARLEAYLPREPRTEQIATEAAVGRILAEDLRAPAALPAFPRSTMDGFAVRAADTHGASEGLPAYLHVRGRGADGADRRRPGGRRRRRSHRHWRDDAAGADAVVMVENTQEVDGHTIEVVRAVAAGENVIQVGEDVTAGEELLGRGHVLRAQDVGGLLALGITRVRRGGPPRGRHPGAATRWCRPTRSPARARSGTSTATPWPTWSAGPATGPGSSASSPTSRRRSRPQPGRPSGSRTS